MPSSPERLGLKVVRARTFDLPQPRTFVETQWRLGPLATVHRSGHADALYKAEGYDSSQRLVAMIPCTGFGFTSTDGLKVACARWVVEKSDWLDIRGAGKTKSTFRSSD